MTATQKQFVMTVAAGVTTAIVLNWVYRHIMPPIGHDDTCQSSQQNGFSFLGG